MPNMVQKFKKHKVSKNMDRMELKGAKTRNKTYFGIEIGMEKDV